MSKLERIAVFISVVEEGSFASAARKKGVSTPAISRQVSSLEAELGAQLLERTTRHVALTPVGEAYYLQCKNALNVLQEADNAIHYSKQEATGILNVMANRYFAVWYLLPKLAEFMQLNPALRVHLQLAERFPNLAKEQVDILFGVSLEGPDDLIRKRIATTRYVICASPQYWQTHGYPKVPSDLINHQYIAHSTRQPDNVIQLKGNKEIILKPYLWLNDSIAMRECAKRGMGFVNLHDYIVSDALKEGSLIEILASYQEPQQNIYLYYQSSRYMQPKIRRFIDFYTK